MDEVDDMDNMDTVDVVGGVDEPQGGGRRVKREKVRNVRSVWEEGTRHAKGPVAGIAFQSPGKAVRLLAATVCISAG